MQPSTSSVESAKYGKVPRSVGVAKNVSSEHFIRDFHNGGSRARAGASCMETRSVGPQRCIAL